MSTITITTTELKARSPWQRDAIEEYLAWKVEKEELARVSEERLRENTLARFSEVLSRVGVNVYPSDMRLTWDGVTFVCCVSGVFVVTGECPQCHQDILSGPIGNTRTLGAVLLGEQGPIPHDHGPQCVGVAPDGGSHDHPLFEASGTASETGYNPRDGLPGICACCGEPAECHPCPIEKGTSDG